MAKHKSRLKEKLKPTDNDVPEYMKFDALEEAKKYLLMMLYDYPKIDIDIALEELGYPYGLQTVMGRLLKRVDDVKIKFGKSEELIPIKFTSP